MEDNSLKIRDLSGVTMAEFAPLVGEVFHALYADDSVPFELLAVTLSERARGRTRPFRLTFRGPPEPAVQAVFPLYHPVVGRCDILMVPSGPEEPGQAESPILYHAIFS